MKKVATLILQRNLPDVTNALGDHVLKWNGDLTDLYVVESGSDDDQLSKFADTTFHASWDEAKEKGMHFPRGFNYGLLELLKLEKDYEFIVLMMGDTQLYDEPTYEIMLNEMAHYDRCGILTPVSRFWGDIKSIPENTTKAHWLLPHVCWMFRKQYIDDVCEKNDPTYMNFLYDGSNFRGYDTDTELCLKGYQNDWFFGVTTKCSHHEISDLTEKNYEQMKTEKFSTHLNLMFNEGIEWLNRKYGFENKQQMRSLIMSEYMKFFNRHPELSELII